MTEIDEEVRELLRRKAGEVPHHDELPGRVAGRARRRIAVNAIGIALGVAVVVVGATAGLRVARTGANQPATGGATAPVASPTTPSPSGGAIAGCTAGDLRVTGSIQGAAGSREGLIVLTDVADGPCTLQGTPTITLLDQSGQPITSGVSFGTSPAQWQADAQPQPAGWPVVKLEPGAAAQVRLRWSNWCPDGAAAPGWQIALPGGGSATVSALNDLGPPPCNGRGQPSTVEVGPFEPSMERGAAG